MTIRKAIEADVPQMVELSKLKRAEYGKYQPVFWKKAKDSREKQTLLFKDRLKRDQVIALVEEDQGTIRGFILAKLVGAPPVYDPGGHTCFADDFVVGEGQDWKEVGRGLLEEARRQSRERGAVQTTVFSGHMDQPKRDMLSGLGFTIATETYVKGITGEVPKQAVDRL
jgi:GNAT superfamily N-acetyltransferase